MKKTISILLPGFATIPMGGFKVMFEYSNRLINDGFDVYLYFPATILGKERGLKYNIRQFVSWQYRRISKTYLPKTWFLLDPKIKTRSVFSLDNPEIYEHDILIATSAETAEYLTNIPDKKKGFYFIQGKENWNISENRLKATYGIGLNNIVISKWLHDYVKTSGNDCTIIPNGFDFNYFKCYSSIEKRDKFSLCMLYHIDERKDTATALSAVKLLKEKYPEITLTMFGAYKEPDNLPKWVRYYKSPDKETHNMIYNDASIFVASSKTEGWGLTVGEAMICGCAVACTDTNGFREMVVDEYNGLISPVSDIYALEKNIEMLINNDSLRIKLARNGRESIRAFSWDSSYLKLKNLLMM